MRIHVTMLAVVATMLTAAVAMAEETQRTAGDGEPWHVARVSASDHERPAAADAAGPATTGSYLHIRLAAIAPEVAGKLHTFRIINARGEEVGDLASYLKPTSRLIFEGNWASLAGLYLEGLDHREPLFDVREVEPVAERHAPAQDRVAVVDRPDYHVDRRDVHVDRPDVYVDRPDDYVVRDRVIDDRVVVDRRDRVVVDDWDRDTVIHEDHVVDRGERHVYHDGRDEVVHHHRSGGGTKHIYHDDGPRVVHHHRRSGGSGGGVKHIYHGSGGGNGGPAVKHVYEDGAGSGAGGPGSGSGSADESCPCEGDSPGETQTVVHHGPGEGEGAGPGAGEMAMAMGPGEGPGMGAGGAPGPGPGFAPGMGAGPGQGECPCEGEEQSPGNAMAMAPGQGPGAAPGEGPGPAQGEGPGPANGPGGPNGAGGYGPQTIGPKVVGPKVIGPKVIRPNLNIKTPTFRDPRVFYDPRVEFDPRLLYNPNVRYGDRGYGRGGGAGQGGGGGGYDELARAGLKPELPKPEAHPAFVMYVSAGEEGGAGKVYQMNEHGRTLGWVNLPYTPSSLALHREHGLVTSLPRDGGRLVHIDDTGKTNTLIDKDDTMVHPVDVALAGGSDSILVADNMADVLMTTSTGGIHPQVYRRFDGQKWSAQDMSVAVTRDGHVILGTNGDKGIHRFSGDKSQATSEPILPEPGGVAADPKSLRWAATQGHNEIYIFEGEELVKKLKLPPGKAHYRGGKLSFGPAGTIFTVIRSEDEVIGEPWFYMYDIEEDKQRTLFPWEKETMTDFVVGPRMLWERKSPKKYESTF